MSDTDQQPSPSPAMLASSLLPTTVAARHVKHPAPEPVPFTPDPDESTNVDTGEDLDGCWAEPAAPAEITGSSAVGLFACEHDTDDASGYGVVTDTGYIYTGTLPHRKLAVGYLAAFEHVVMHPDMQGRTYDLYCDDEDFLTEIAPYAAAWGFTLHGITGRLVRLARKEVRAALGITGDGFTPAQAPPAPTIMYAATDGSARSKFVNQPVGFGWMTACGRHGQGHLKRGTVVIAELAAIHNLLKNTSRHQRLVVMADSKVALNAVRKFMDGQPVSKVHISGAATHPVMIAELAQMLHERRDLLTFQWVRSHSGHVLNEAADRLAVYARRSTHLKTPAAVTRETIIRIVEDVREELAANPFPEQDGAHVPESTPTAKQDKAPINS